MRLIKLPVFTDMLKMLLNVGLQAKCSHRIRNLDPWIHFSWQICDRK